MQKESIVEKITKKYLVLKEYNDIALIYEDNPFIVGLANIKEQKIILEPKFTYQYLENNYFILEKDNEVTIYDAKNQQFLFKDYYRFYHNYVFNSSVNNKYWLFDSKLSNLIGDFDLIKHIENNFNDYFILYKGSKHGLYCIGKGLIEPVIYQNIYQASDKLIFETKSKSFYININDYKYQRSKDYENIKVINDYLYCYSKNYIDIIKYHSEEQIPRFDEVKLSNDKEYIVKQNKQYGLYDNISKSLLLDVRYDDILKSKDDYLVMLNGKVGFYSKKYFIEPIYDNIVNNDFLYLYHQNLVDIAYNGKIYVKDCQIIDMEKDNVIFKKDERFGLITKKFNDVNVYENKDSISKKHEAFGEVYYLYQQDRQALIINGCKIVNYVEGDISYHFFKNLYIAVNTLNESKLYLVKGRKLIEIGNYNNIIFFEHFIMIESDLNVELIDYENLKVMKSLPLTTRIEQLDKGMYLLNNDYYIFKEHKLLPLITKEYELYKTTYTDEKTKISYEITSDNKDEHDRLCYQVDNNDNGAILLSDMVEEESYKKDFSSIKLVRKIG